jgi:hypothetical protein
MKLSWILISILLLTLSITSYGQRLQAIHNAADPALSTIDIYISVFGIQQEKFEDVPFRAATSFIDVPLPNLPISVGIAPGNSTSINDTLRNFTVVVPSGVTYIGLIHGVVDTSQFAPNPDGLDISLDAAINFNGRETSNNPGETDFFFVHGVTDAPTLDIDIRNGANLVSNSAFGDQTSYISLTSAPYVVDISESGSGTILHSYLLDLTNLADSAVTLFASGFMDPDSNQNGESFGLFAATPGGNVIEFSTPTAIGEPLANYSDGFELQQNYPNPFNPLTRINYQLAFPSHVEITVYNMLGQEIRKLVSRDQSSGTHQIQWNGKDEIGRDAASGVYIYKLVAGEFVQGRKMLLLR